MGIDEIVQRKQRKQNCLIASKMINSAELINICEQLRQSPLIDFIALSLADDISPSELNQLNHPNIKTLKIRDCKLSEEHIKVLASFSTLENLTLERCQIDDAKAEILANTTTIKSLNLNSNQIGLPGIKAVVKNPHIERINLIHNKVSDETIETLVSSKSLKKLYVGMDDISKEGTESLLKGVIQRTDLRVDFWGSTLIKMVNTNREPYVNGCQLQILNRVEYLDHRDNIISVLNTFKGNHKVKSRTLKLLELVEEIYQTNSPYGRPTLTQVLKDTHGLLNGKMTPEDYEKSANKLRIRTFSKEDALILAMLGLAALCASISIGLAVASCGVIPISIAAAGGATFFGIAAGVLSFKKETLDESMRKLDLEVMLDESLEPQAIDGKTHSL